MKILKVINALKIQSQVKNHSLLSKMSLFTLSPTPPPPNSHTHSGGLTVPFKTREARNVHEISFNFNRRKSLIGHVLPISWMATRKETKGRNERKPTNQQKQGTPTWVPLKRTKCNCSAQGMHCNSTEFFQTYLDFLGANLILFLTFCLLQFKIIYYLCLIEIHFTKNLLLYRVTT